MTRLFGTYVPLSILLLLLSEVLLVTAAFALVTYLTVPLAPDVFLLYEGGSLRILVVISCVFFFLHMNDLYTEIQISSRIVLAEQLCTVLGATFLMHALISYVWPGMRLSIRIMLPGSALTLIMIYSWRIFYNKHILGTVGKQRLLVIGCTPLIAEIADRLDRHPELGMMITGYVDCQQPENPPVHCGKALGSTQVLREIADTVKPDRIVLALSEERAETLVEDLLELRHSGYFIEGASHLYEKVYGRVCVREMHPTQFIFYTQPPPRNVFVQRFFNWCIALVGIIVTLPLMLLTALVVRLSSPGPILYRQVRVGLGGTPFTLYKFRSMRADAEIRTGAVWASKNDPRITPVGKLLRKRRLDELPQLFNVLLGDMSIVGPRPERPEFVKKFERRIFYYNERHAVRPGITGWAQINYKYADTVEDSITKLEYDLYYINNMSLTLDLYIVFQTIKTVLLTRGAQ
jgi:sugar transferase (PEP-CTERM system associated)